MTAVIAEKDVKAETQNDDSGQSRSKPRVEAFGGSTSTTDDHDKMKPKQEKWSLGVLNDKETDEVPGQSATSCYSAGCSLWDREH